MQFRNRLFIVLCIFITGDTHAQTLERQLQQMIDSIYTANPKSIGCMVHVEAPRKRISWTYAVGYADKDARQKLSAAQPILLASNTKTYVAAAIMRLVEQRKLTMDQPVQKLLTAKTAALLSGVGYHLDRITLAHLMSHTSGITDYVNDNYFETVNKDRAHKWTRDEQIALAARVGGPYAEPEDSFRYADLNYLLLTEVIETTTAKPFYEAMRSLLSFQSLGLSKTWFVQLEKAPPALPPFAHQYWNKYPWDSYDLDPSWDLYGGGGMAATVKDMALFYQYLFDGKIIRDTQVLAEMHKDVPVKSVTNYRYGLRKLSLAGFTGYYHGGFWGTDVIYFPELDASVAIVILEKSERALSAGMSSHIATMLK